MFSIFKKKTDENIPENYDPEKLTVHYEGGVISADYEAETLFRSQFNDQGYPFHNLLPHGYGTIVYKYDGDIIEQYEGQFNIGQYHGKGTLVDRHGEIHEGIFKENLFEH